MINDFLNDHVEPLFYPNTSVFVNRLGISDVKIIRQKEADFTAIRSIELLQNTHLILPSFDFKHLKSIHQYLFQDLYEWAGKARSYDVKKDQSIFTPANQLQQYEHQVFQCSIDYYNRSERPSLKESAGTLARCLGIINIYHPFPEGNGRTQRIFISILAHIFDYTIDWNSVYAWEIVETSIQVHHGNYEPLIALMQRIIIDDKP